MVLRILRYRCANLTRSFQDPVLRFFYLLFLQPMSKPFQFFFSINGKTYINEILYFEKTEKIYFCLYFGNAEVVIFIYVLFLHKMLHFIVLIRPYFDLILNEQLYCKIKILFAEKTAAISFQTGN